MRHLVDWSEGRATPVGLAGQERPRSERSDRGVGKD